jgi:adenosylhomocysteine nucleosidase
MKRLWILLICLCCICISFAGAEGTDDGAQSAGEECIGIISAMDSEIELLLANMETEKIEEIGGIKFHSGSLCGMNVVIVRAGIGKCLAASSTSTMLNRFPVTSLIFTGIAGGVGDETHLLDIVVADRLVQHDYGIMNQEGFEWKPAEGGSEGFYICDEKLVDTACEAAAEVLGETHVFRGLIATGDQFIASENYVKVLQERFGALACEMEGAATAVVCEAFGVPYVIIRCMSDKADGQAHEKMENMGTLAADNSGRIVMCMLEKMSVAEGKDTH